MKITLENTTKIVELMIRGVSVPARVWQGNNDSVDILQLTGRIRPEEGQCSSRSLSENTLTLLIRGME